MGIIGNVVATAGMVEVMLTATVDVTVLVDAEAVPDAESEAALAEAESVLAV